MDNIRQHLVLDKGEEVYIFAYEAGQEAHVLEALIAQAQDSRTTFDWFDVALLESKLKEVSLESTNSHGPVRPKPPNPATGNWFQMPCGLLWFVRRLFGWGPPNMYLPDCQVKHGSPQR
jgi:hypothetical protein